MRSCFCLLAIASLFPFVIIAQESSAGSVTPVIGERVRQAIDLSPLISSLARDCYLGGWSL